MSSFSADWLTRREPYDRAARNPDVLAAVAAAVSHLAPLQVVDLACGTGSTLRAIIDALPARQNWRLIDNDLSLLARAGGGKQAEGTMVTPVPIDLAHDLEAALDGPVDLVTASALLDLVSDSWLQRLVIEIGARRIGFYAALSYDGRIAFDPALPFDREVIGAFNAHQSGDKGFGAALGPEAPQTAAARFRAIGYVVTAGEADWRLGPGDGEMQAALLEGWAAAALESGRLSFPQVAEWLAQRRTLTPSTTLRVGHVDFFARPQIAPI